MNCSMVVMGLGRQCQNLPGPKKGKLEGNSQGVSTQGNRLDAECGERSSQCHDVCALIGNNLFVALTDVRCVPGVSEILRSEVGEALAVKFAFDVFQRESVLNDVHVSTTW